MPRRPPPIPTDLTQGFWDAAARHELAVQRCQGCGARSHPPVPVCARCSSEDLRFEAVSGAGVVYCFSVMTDELVAGFEDTQPLLVIAVELDEEAGLVLVANLVAEPGHVVNIGDRVEVTFEDLPGGGSLPQFRPVETVRQGP